MKKYVVNMRVFLFAFSFLMLCIFANAGDDFYKFDDNVGLDLSTSTFKATGIGFCDLTNKLTLAEAKIQAERAAMTDAQRKLAETVVGVRVIGDTTVENYVIQNDTIKTSVRALVKGARPVGNVVYNKEENQISAEVTLEAPISKDGNFANIILPYVKQQIIDNVKPASPPDDSQELASTIDLSDLKEGEAFQSKDYKIVIKGELPKVTKASKSDSAKSDSGKTETSEITKSSDTPKTETTNETIPEQPKKSESVAKTEDAKKAEVKCPKCGYKWMADSTGGELVCPKCGFKFTPAEIKSEPAAKEESKPEVASEPSKADDKEINITGIIFNTAGKKYKLCLAPMVNDEEGRNVMNITMIKPGAGVTVFDLYSVDKTKPANHKRVKITPIEIDVKDVNKGVIIISDEDAKKILLLNKDLDLIGNGKVLFLID